MFSADFGRLSAFARRARTAVLAAPSAAAADTRTFRTDRPASSRTQPSMASRPPLGVTRTASSIGSAESLDDRREDQRQQIEPDALDHQQDDDRADVDAADR